MCGMQRVVHPGSTEGLTVEDHLRGRVLAHLEIFVGDPKVKEHVCKTSATSAASREQSRAPE